MNAPRPAPIAGFRRWHPWAIAAFAAYAGGVLAIADTGHDVELGDVLRVAFFAIPSLVLALPFRRMGAERAWDAEERTAFAAGLWLATAGMGVAALVFWISLPYDDVAAWRWCVAPLGVAAALLGVAIARDLVRARWARRVIAAAEPGFETRAATASDTAPPLFHGEREDLIAVRTDKAGGPFREVSTSEPIAMLAARGHATTRVLVALGLASAWAFALWATRGPVHGSGFTPPPRYAISFPGSAAVASLALGNDAACAVDVEHRASCWVEHDRSLSRGLAADAPPKTLAAPFDPKGAPIRALSIGLKHTCALSPDGAVRCVPSSGAIDALGGVKAIAAGHDFTCAVVAGDGVRCWGLGVGGVLGNGTREDALVPVRVAGTESAADVRAGVDHACALLEDGRVVCWGSNEHGQLGRDGADTKPAVVDGLAGVKQIAVGWSRSLALLADGTVRAWGANDSGALGDGTTEDRRQPVAVAGLRDAVEIASGTHHSCARLRDGAVRCWGWNSTGALGDGTRRNRPTPVDAGVKGALEIATGGSSSCARFADRVECWGEN